MPSRSSGVGVFDLPADAVEHQLRRRVVVDELGEAPTRLNRLSSALDSGSEFGPGRDRSPRRVVEEPSLS
jgi:hypothetical protein